MMIRRGSGPISSFTNKAGEEVSNIRTGENQVTELVDVRIDPLEQLVTDVPEDKQQ